MTTLTRGLLLTASVLLIAQTAWAYPPVVPELDPGSAALGVALLAGSLLVWSGRRRR